MQSRVYFPSPTTQSVDKGAFCQAARRWCRPPGLLVTTHHPPGRPLDTHTLPPDLQKPLKKAGPGQLQVVRSTGAHFQTVRRRYNRPGTAPPWSLTSRNPAVGGKRTFYYPSSPLLDPR